MAGPPEGDRPGRPTTLVGALLARAAVGTPAGLTHVDPTALVGLTIDAAADVLSVGRVGLMLLDDDDHLRVVGASDAVAEAIESAQVELRIGPGLDTLRDDRTVIVGDLAACERYGPLSQRLAPVGPLAVLSSPVRIDGSVIGNLNALRSGPHEWTAQEVRANEAYANVIGVMLHLAATSHHAATAAHLR